MQLNACLSVWSLTITSYWTCIWGLWPPHTNRTEPREHPWYSSLHWGSFFFFHNTRATCSCLVLVHILAMINFGIYFVFVLSFWVCVSKRDRESNKERQLSMYGGRPWWDVQCLIISPASGLGRNTNVCHKAVGPRGHVQYMNKAQKFRLDGQLLPDYTPGIKCIDVPET